MPQSTDITINGAGYMVAPRSYKRLQDGMAEGRTERITLTDFFGGQRRSLQLERDKFASSLNIGPALDGQGVRPWGANSLIAGAVITGTFPDRDKPMPYVIVRDRLYFAIGNTLYRGPGTVPNGIHQYIVAATYPNPIFDICIYSSYGILVSFGAAADIVWFNTNTNTSVVLFATERGTVMAAYAGFAAWSDAKASGLPTTLRLVSGSSFDERRLDHDPIAITTIGAEMLVVTKQALYTYTGRVKEVTAPGGTGTLHQWSGELTPFFQQGVFAEQDDYKMLLGFGGRTIAWIAGGVHELVPSGDRAGWRTTGLSGKRCFGGTVAAGYVIVCIESHAGKNEIWAYDGNGWWCLYSVPMTANPLCWPMPVGGASSIRMSFICFQHGGASQHNFRIVEIDSSYALSPTAEFVTPLIDASERDKPKAWRKVGAVFASPELAHNQASTDIVAVYLDYSIDNGATWAQAANQSLTGNTMANLNFELYSSLSGLVSSFIQLRVRLDQRARLDAGVGGYLDRIRGVAQSGPSPQMGVADPRP